MPIDMCDLDDVLACNASFDDELFKSLVIIGLAQLINAVNASSGGGEGVVLEQESRAFGTITPVFTPLLLLDSTKKLRHLYVDNQTDANIEISLDGGATVAFTAFANSSLSRDLGAYVGAATTSIQIRSQAATPATIGTAYFDGSY